MTGLFDYAAEATHDPGGRARFRLQPGVRGDAEFSPCGKYRHWLSRWWSDGSTLDVDGHGMTLLPYALWIGMNPSTAEADVDDPTVRKEVRFTRAMNLCCYIKCNVMDYRATSPHALLWVKPRSDANLATIAERAARASVIVAAWGALPKRLRQYADEALSAIQHYQVMCLGQTRDGSPRHPLYVRNDTTLEVYR